MGKLQSDRKWRKYILLPIINEESINPIRELRQPYDQMTMNSEAMSLILSI